MTDDVGPSWSLLDPEVLRRLIRHLQATDVDELEVVSGTSRFYLRRELGARVEGRIEGRESDDFPGVAVSAPLSGVFYSRSSPDQPPYVTPGDFVEAGQTVALIETMKTYNEVTVDQAGEILSVNARDGEMVEAGQALFHLGPAAPESLPLPAEGAQA